METDELEVTLWSHYGMLVPYINVYICDLLEIAEYRGKCKYDMYGDIYLDAIPEQELCKSVRSAMNGKLLIQFGEVIKQYYWEHGVDERDGIAKSIKEILEWCFVVTDEENSTDGKTYVKIVGHTPKDKKKRLSHFYPLSFYKFIYEADEIEDKGTFYSRYLEIPYKINEYIVSGKKTKRTKEIPGQWYREMRTFMETEADRKEWYDYYEDIDLDRIKRMIPYLQE